MNKTRTTSILMIASVSAAVHGLAAVVFVPVLSFILLAVGEPPASFRNMIAATDNGMLFAVLIPLLYALIGFIVGGFLALVHAVLTAEDPAPRAPEESTEIVPEAVLTAVS
ncbi:MAG: hypothetical protein LAP21_20785 [Acidobacteriia bacterium]|nr:hypothetical protein [Terriglobia bacterium]